MSPDACERAIEGVTGFYGSPYDHINSNDELCSNQTAKCTRNPFVLPCHGVYPVARGTQHGSALIRRESPDRNVIVISARTMVRVE